MNEDIDCSTRMTTFTGLYVDPRALTLDEIVIEDIAHGLSNTCRFSGQCIHNYSVAQHSVLVARQMPTNELKRVALLHDAPEAYLCDLVRCVKRGLGDYCAMEDWIWDSVVRKFNLQVHVPVTEGRDPHYGMPPEVIEADFRMLVTERLQLLSEKSRVWDMQKKYDPYDLTIARLTPEEAEERFLDAYFTYFLCV